MAIGTITKVWPKGLTKNGKNGPGSVVFSDGKKISTFDDAILATALNGIGQLAEYTVEQNGKYENLGSLTLKGASPSATARPDVERVNATAGDLAVASAIKDLTAAVRELTSQMARQPRAVQTPQGLVTTSVSISEGQPEPVPVDPLVAAQAKLAKAVESDEAAQAMFDAMRKKHKDPEKLAEAVDKCLKAHGVEG